MQNNLKNNQVFSVIYVYLTIIYTMQLTNTCKCSRLYTVSIRSWRATYVLTFLYTVWSLHVVCSMCVTHFVWGWSIYYTLLSSQSCVDYVFNQQQTTCEIYDTLVKPMVVSSLEGYNGMWLLWCLGQAKLIHSL